ncbi:hypothetical protein M9H77_24262 [Catharanthus roseus]|uniref:Uncharacterized protein n=1 Tax=Catharanthus roseus TaxID=4058 RepID=A0ACC0AWL6_CATRO|nr:hypothetical protein M9H77_24262 [Catharanthus roseus]
MSCLNFKHLFPATKPWKKLFTNKLIQTKLLYNLNFKRSKTRFKKSKKRIICAWPTLGVRRSRFKPKRKPYPKALGHDFQKSHHHRSSYIDHQLLFIEPTVKKQAAASASNSSGINKEKEVEEMGHSGEVYIGDSADDMWESLVLASPQMMNGINEKADEFIAKFRAEMRLQERLARRRL